MKSTTAYYLILLYLTIMVRPLLPMASDWWSHQFNRIEHEAIVHAKYGSKHLQKELADVGTEDSQAKNQNNLKTEEGVFFHLSPESGKYDHYPIKPLILYFVFKPGKLPFIPLSIQGPPPKFS